jgi:hypothetical protein
MFYKRIAEWLQDEACSILRQITRTSLSEYAAGPVLVLMIERVPVPLTEWKSCFKWCFDLKGRNK